MLPKLFYIIQVVFIVVSWLLLFEAIFIIPNSVMIERRKVPLELLNPDQDELPTYGQWSRQSLLLLYRLGL
jgi:hypothetical protein